MRLLFMSLWYMHVKEIYLCMAEEIRSKKKMSRSLRMNNKIMKALKEISAHKNKIQKVSESNFDKQVQVKYEINELEARKDEELGHIIRKNRYFGRLVGGREEKRIDEIEKSRREKENELKNLFAIGNELIDLLLELDEIIRDLKTMLKKNDIKTQWIGY